MEDKKTLMNYLSHVPCESDCEGLFGSCSQRKHGDCGEIAKLPYCCLSKIADHLIDKGVTTQGAADTNVGSKWISVKDRLPDLVPCGAGTAYSEAVNVLTAGRKVLTAIWDGTEFIADAEFWEAENEEITHWAPVPLPLPEPEKR